MILVDTTVWVDHLRSGNSRLVEHLRSGAFLCHLLIIAELALGTLKSRGQVLSLLDDLPKAPDVTTEEIRASLIEYRKLHGRGIGVVDLYLVASCLLGPGTSLWTGVRRLHAVAVEMGVPVEQASN